VGTDAHWCLTRRQGIAVGRMPRLLKDDEIIIDIPHSSRPMTSNGLSEETSKGVQRIAQVILV
jgi:hypothetical protein